ncbi:unnamed protein product [Mytilus coruscus]|uniref:Paired domain-containing protein n=1 Tax=Mytilus coruscus TaxID=42192 RepID=A0A6J8EJ88_MYTCO|nr:unnamed protein product [Mytilus coruscus]
MQRGSKVTPENQETSTECVSNYTVLVRTRGGGRGRGGRGRGRKVSPSPDNYVTNTSDTNEQTQNINSDQQNSETEQPANADNKKRKRSKPLEIPQEKQDEVADWYRENELLYNKAYYQYIDTALKNTRWQAKANEQGIEDWQSLRTWVESMRSQLRHEKEINLVLLKEKLKAKYGTDACVDSPSEHEDEEESQEDDDSRSQCYLEETSSTIDIPSPIVKKKYQKVQSPVEKDIQKAIKQSSELQQQVQAKLASHSDMPPERKNWGHSMVSILPGFDDRLWGRFKRERMDVLDRFQNESKELRSRDKQRLQQLQTGICLKTISKYICGVENDNNVKQPKWDIMTEEVLTSVECFKHTKPSLIYSEIRKKLVVNGVCHQQNVPSA